MADPTEAHDKVVGAILDQNPGEDLEKKDEYLAEVHTTYIDNVKSVDDYRTKKQHVKQEEHETAKIQAETGKVLIRVTQELESQREVCSKMSLELDRWGQENAIALKEVTASLSDELQKIPEDKPSSKLRLDSLKFPTWDGNEKFFWMEEDIPEPAEREAGDHVRLSRIMNVVPPEWQARLILCKTEALGEFEHVITKDKMQKQVYVDFKKMKVIKEPVQRISTGLSPTSDFTFVVWWI